MLNGEGRSHGAHVAVRELSRVLSQDNILAVLAVASACRSADRVVPTAKLLGQPGRQQTCSRAMESTLPS
jgi:hypothetical protein